MEVFIAPQTKYSEPQEPFVTVIIPVFNRGDRFLSTLSSAIEQTYKNYEIIVIDDCSSDKTDKYIQNEIASGKCRYIGLDENVGSPMARNIAVEHARGEILAFLDHDDLWSPDYLSEQVAALENSSCAVSAYCNYQLSETSGGAKLNNSFPGQDNFLYRMLVENFIHSLSCVVVRKDAFEKVGGLPVEYLVCHDILLYMKLSEIGQVKYNAKSLVTLDRSDSFHLNNIDIWKAEIFSIFDRQEIEKPLKAIWLFKISLKLARSFKIVPAINFLFQSLVYLLFFLTNKASR